MKPDPRPPADRLGGFVAEANSLEGVEATDFETSAAVSVVGDEDKSRVDLRPVFRAAVRYGLVAFEGHAAAKSAELHFKPAETAFEDGDSE
ncbi:hypothetical protein [Natrinema versiforme]|uniref:Uncharacterized protein n=1 Tax=Natrinema versiforme JCM 10478 TaxID=1227496 RepID=L9Y4C4_9EURY|nr:hypothetical protein [Natrinema versiforme]ELY68920.1 hypothetical protein C489_06123 [Natrinema versiforme JCM 10478]